MRWQSISNPLAKSVMVSKQQYSSVLLFLGLLFTVVFRTVVRKQQYPEAPD
jgi:hypothetical protein